MRIACLEQFQEKLKPVFRPELRKKTIEHFREEKRKCSKDPI
jgi:hypothetical protein